VKVQAIATITCVGGFFSPRKKENAIKRSGNPLEAMGWQKDSGCTQ
jgi:hypothetical protein